MNKIRAFLHEEDLHHIQFVRRGSNFLPPSLSKEAAGTAVEADELLLTRTVVSLAGMERGLTPPKEPKLPDLLDDGFDFLGGATGTLERGALDRVSTAVRAEETKRITLNINELRERKKKLEEENERFEEAKRKAKKQKRPEPSREEFLGEEAKTLKTETVMKNLLQVPKRCTSDREALAQLQNHGLRSTRLLKELEKARIKEEGERQDHLKATLAKIRIKPGPAMWELLTTRDPLAFEYVARENALEDDAVRIREGTRGASGDCALVDSGDCALVASGGA